jgi:hypothetical protein
MLGQILPTKKDVSCTIWIKVLLDGQLIEGPYMHLKDVLVKSPKLKATY